MELSVLNKKWETKESPERESLHLSQTKDIDITIANILTARDITTENYDSFINPTLKDQTPDPSILKDCEKASKIIADSIENGEKITIFGDYDVDGGTATSVFVRFLRDINVNVDFYIPNKLTEGYGPNENALKQIAKDGANLMITVDCGISAFSAMETAEIPVIIIDHHIADKKLPKAVAIVNPQRLDDTSNLGGIAGVGVAFLVCIAISRELEKRSFFKDIKKPNLIDSLDLVALGTVCDVMKLTDLNRVFVAQGLKILNRKTNVGLRALCDLLNIDREIDTFHLGFMFGPRLNAGGRLGGSKLATALMICEDYDEAMEIAKELNDLNETRKDIEGRISEEALAELKDRIKDDELIDNNSFVYNPDWHSGVLGIVASRLKERFNKPAFVLCCDDGVAHGSARSIKGVDLGEIVGLGKKTGVLKDGGGHKMAAGFSCEIGKLDEVKKFLTEQIDKQMAGKEIIDTLYIDGVLSAKGVNLDLLENLQLIAPFGNGNPKPKFCINDLKIAKTIIIQEKHIKCFMSSPYTKGSLETIIFNAVGTKMGDFLLNSKDNMISIVGSLNKNTWNGRSTVQIMLEDAK